jgi:hypothetical protein
MGKPATLKVDIIADSKKAQSELSGFSSKVAGFVAGVSSAGATFAIDKIVQAATAAADAITDGVGKAASLSASLGTLRQNYGDTAQGIQTWAEGAARALGLSEGAAINAVNRFAPYTRILEISGLEAATFSTSLTTLAADLGAFNDLTTEQAIQAIGSAFRGERDPLEKFGILLTDAQVKEAYFQKTGEKVTGTLSTQQNVVGTLAALYEQATPAIGAFAREGDQLGSKTQILGAEFDNLKTKLGEKLLPYVLQFSDWILNSGIPALQGFAGWISDNVVPAIESLWSWITDSLVPALQSLWDWVEQYILPAFEKLSNWVKTELMPRLEELWKLMQERLGPIFKDIADNAKEAWGEFQELRDKLEPLISTIGSFIGPAVGIAFLAVLNGITTASYLIQYYLKFVSIMVDGWASVIGRVTPIFQGFWDILKGLWENLQKIASWIMPDWLSSIGGFFSGAWDLVTGNGGGGGGNNTPEVPASPQTNNFTVNVPPGMAGQDAGQAIVDELRLYLNRNPGTVLFPNG